MTFVYYEGTYMKLVRFGEIGNEKPGIIDEAGNLLDLSTIIKDWDPKTIEQEQLIKIKNLDFKNLPKVSGDVRLGVPVAGIRQFIAVGLNYREHAKEANLDIPTEPVIFQKAITSLSGANDAIQLPDNSEMTDWELELGFIVNRVVKNISKEEALGCIAGYCLANDVSERNWQLHRNGQWGKGKSFETFGPVGPWLVTSDEIINPQSIEFELTVNGETVQSANTNDMIFSVAEILSYLSQFMTLLPGDLVITGTPSGVGAGMKPPKFLRKGDIVELRSEQLGTQRQLVT